MDYTGKKKIDDKRKKKETQLSDEKCKKQDKIRETFAQRFKYACKDRNTTIYQVAKQTGISSGLLGSYAKAEKAPVIYNARIIAEHLGVSLDWLCGKGDMITGVNPWENYSIPNALLTVFGKYEPEIKINKKSPYVVLYFKLNGVTDDADTRKNLIEFLKSYSTLVNTTKRFDVDYKDFNKLYIKLLKDYENIL